MNALTDPGEDSVVKNRIGRTLLAAALLLAVAGAVVVSSRRRSDKTSKTPERSSGSKSTWSLLNVAVTDRRGRYIRSLKPGDFRVFEDGIPQTLATFAEGNQAPQQLTGSTTPGAPLAASEPKAAVMPGPAPVTDGMDGSLVGTNVFVLFDTSNFTVPQLRLRRGRYRRLHPRPRRGGLRCGLWVQPQPDAPRFADVQPLGRDSGTPPLGGRRRNGALQRAPAHPS